MKRTHHTHSGSSLKYWRAKWFGSNQSSLHPLDTPRFKKHPKYPLRKLWRLFREKWVLAVVAHRLAKLDPFPEGKDRVSIVTLHGCLTSQWNLHPFLKMAKLNYKKRMRRICQKKNWTHFRQLQQFKRIQWAPLEKERYIEWSLGLVNQDWHWFETARNTSSLYYLHLYIKYIYIKHYLTQAVSQEGWAFFHPWTPMFIKHNRKSTALQSRFKNPVGFTWWYLLPVTWCNMM